ncbi:MAG: Holliday junction resolvase RuvX [Gammaproteobacteria bacterium]|nr:Holliday junction resolvase RuvX [Gammaproteobacteria bacterium]MCY4344396.1 Holliday junction resolvase RuvX [Gammaproteobacteria bacterium]
MPETVLAVDFGLKHVGLAVGQTVSRTATPLGAIAARDGVPDWRLLDAAIGEWRPHRLLVGLPLNMDGTVSEMAERARRFAAVLRNRHAQPVELIDERLSTREAKRLQPDGDSHSVAAALIAETWLNG